MYGIARAVYFIRGPPVFRILGHICENYSPKKAPAGSWAEFDCTGTKMYHWGALTGLIGLEEDGRFAGQGP